MKIISTEINFEKLRYKIGKWQCCEQEIKFRRTMLKNSSNDIRTQRYCKPITFNPILAVPNNNFKKRQRDWSYEESYLIDRGLYNYHSILVNERSASSGENDSKKQMTHDTVKPIITTLYHVIMKSSDQSSICRPTFLNTRFE